MKTIWPPQDETFWYLKHDVVRPCDKNINADIAIVGGGMAGLSAAQAFNAKGKKVVLLEQYYCGAGASGKSSGFITPNAELSLTDFSKRYGLDGARQIWSFIESGVEDIRKNIKQHQFACDYIEQDSLMVANTQGVLKSFEVEHNNLAKCGYKSILYTADMVKEYVGASGYYGGVGYEDTFGINAYLYCQELKKVLQKAGVNIFEETPVIAVNGHVLETLHAQITADYIIICADRFAPDLGLLIQDVYHAQNFLMISQQLTDNQIQEVFPKKSLMVWDSDLIYSYFRLTGQKRLLVGGGSLLKTYASKPEYGCNLIARKLTKYIGQKFPYLTIQFEQMWPGLIGISKDIGPIAGRDKNNSFMYYIAAAAGLPIAAALGRYSAEHIIDGKTDLDRYFSPYRAFPISGIVQTILGNKLSFALSNLIKTSSI